MVRLVDGTPTVGAPPAGVRIVVGDGAGGRTRGMFDVTARADRLVAVGGALVGGVEVRGRDARVLRAGETWLAEAAPAPAPGNTNEPRNNINSAAAAAAAAMATALLSPANEKCGSSLPSSGRGSGTARGSPSAASRSTAGPPGKPSPRILAVLSNASPSASSIVVASRR